MNDTNIACHYVNVMLDKIARIHSMQPGKLSSLPNRRWKQVTLIATFPVTLMMVLNKTMRMEEVFLIKFLISWSCGNKDNAIATTFGAIVHYLVKRQQNRFLHAKNRKPYLI